MNQYARRDGRIWALRELAMKESYDDTQLYAKARLMGVSSSTAKNYVKTVREQLRKVRC